MGGRGERGCALLLLVCLLMTSFVTYSIRDVTEIGNGDQAGYLTMARGLLEGEGFVSYTVKQYDWVQQSLITPDVVEPGGASIGIAFFYALFGITPLTGKLFSILAALLITPLLVYALARTWKLSQRVSFFAGLFTLLYPVSFYVHLYAFSDDPLALWILAGLLCFFRAKGRSALFALGGVFFAFALMTKYTAVFFWLVLGAYGLWAIWKSVIPGLTLRHLTLFFVVAVFVATPFFARNIAYFGSPLFSVTSAQTWTIGYEPEGGSARVFFWDEGAPTIRWTLAHVTADDVARKFTRVFGYFFREELVLFFFTLCGLFLLRKHPVIPFVVSITSVFLIFFLLIAHYEGRYFIPIHAFWSIAISACFFAPYRFARLRTLAGVGLLILILVFLGLKFYHPDTQPYVDTEATVMRQQFFDAITTLVPPNEPVMTYYPRGTAFALRRPVLTQLNEDAGTFLRIARQYGAQYIECGRKAPELMTDERFIPVFEGYYSLCKIDWAAVQAQGLPPPAFTNTTQDWSLSLFRPRVSKTD